MSKTRGKGAGVLDRRVKRVTRDLHKNRKEGSVEMALSWNAHIKVLHSLAFCWNPDLAVGVSMQAALTKHCKQKKKNPTSSFMRGRRRS